MGNLLLINVLITGDVFFVARIVFFLGSKQNHRNAKCTQLHDFQTQKIAFNNVLAKLNIKSLSYLDTTSMNC